MKRIVFKENNIDLEVIKNELNNDGIIIYPTDTVYGVGASIDSLKGLQKIYEAKERNFSSPLIALLSKVEYIEKIAIIDEEKKNNYRKVSK